MNSVSQIETNIAKGNFKPNMYLTNMSISFFQDDSDYVSDKIFPIVPVPVSSARYYKFSASDLMRDNVMPKPQFGRVTPALMGLSDDLYSCRADQILIGIDQLEAVNYQRASGGAVDPRRAKVRFAVEQMKIHMDRLWAEGFMKPEVWAEVYEGSDNPAGAGKFHKWSDPDSDPISFMATARLEMKLRGKRYPNRLCLGVNAYTALLNNPSVLERVKYSGSTLNPAAVNENVLAQLFQVDKVCVLGSVWNAGGVGKDESKFICSPDDALLVYASNAPAIDEPSAGYIFAWDILGSGGFMTVSQFEGEQGSHTEFVEGLMAYDMKIVSNDLGIYLKDCI